MAQSKKGEDALALEFRRDKPRMPEASRRYIQPEFGPSSAFPGGIHRNDLVDRTNWRRRDGSEAFRGRIRAY